MLDEGIVEEREEHRYAIASRAFLSSSHTGSFFYASCRSLFRAALHHIGPSYNFRLHHVRQRLAELSASSSSSVTLKFFAAPVSPFFSH